MMVMMVMMMIMMVTMKMMMMVMMMMKKSRKKVGLSVHNEGRPRLSSPSSYSLTCFILIRNMNRMKV